MKKLTLILILLTASAFMAGAQNNPYKIDDECYSYFIAAGNALDDFETDAFEQAHQKMLETSLRKKDTKAQAIYYVEKLKRSSHLAQYVRKQDSFAWDSQSWNDRIEQERETAQRIARATGYIQYYYYASELCQTYYFNTQQDVLAGEMLTAMMQEARESGEEYALWKSLTYLGKLYQRISDQYSTRKYLNEVVRIYETSNDPTIRRQSITLQFFELGDTYPPESDSARFFYRKAAEACVTSQDSLRTQYYNAQLAVWDNDLASYHHYRDSCLSVASFPNLIRGGKALFSCVDAILAGKPVSSFRADINGLNLRQQMIFTSHLARKRGQWEAASAIQEKHIQRLYADIYLNNSQRLDHLSAKYGHERLSADLADASRQVSRRSSLVAILLAVMLLGWLILALIHKKSKK